MYPMYQWATDMWSMPRSLTGPGVAQTLDYISALIPGLERHKIASGTKVFDWTVPDEFFLRDAYIETMDGRRLVTYADNNLHVIGYSDPVNALVSKAELEDHLYSLPELPNAIPYVTSYYKGRWGFCVTQKQRDAFDCGPFRVVIDSEKKPGFMEYADIVIKGRSEHEILFSTYICHPSMANDNLSGIVVTAAIAKYIQAMNGDHHYTYRFVFVPETIGAIAYLSSRYKHMRENFVAGFVLTCCGDDGDVSYLASRYHGYSDKVAMAVGGPSMTVHSYNDRGSDERQYCWNGIDLMVGSIMRTRYGLFNEYHTSLDNLSFISQENLEDTLMFVKKIIRVMEFDSVKYEPATMCEPFLSKYGLYPGSSPLETPDILKILGLLNGYVGAMVVSKETGIDVMRVVSAMDMMRERGIIIEAER